MQEISRPRRATHGCYDEPMTKRSQLLLHIAALKSSRSPFFPSQAPVPQVRTELYTRVKVNQAWNTIQCVFQDACLHDFAQQDDQSILALPSMHSYQDG